MGLEACKTRRARIAPARALRWNVRHPRSAASRALGLAQAVQARSAGLQAYAGRLPMTLLERPAPAEPGSLAIQLNLRLAGGQGGPAPAELAQPASPPARIVRPVDRPLIELRRAAAPGRLGENPDLPAAPGIGPGPQATPARPSALEAIQRISGQHLRLETAPFLSRPPDERRLPAPAPAPVTGPPAMIVVRPAAGPAVPGEPAETQAAQMPVRRVPPTGPFQAAAEAQVDVGRLAEQVIQAIDRRIIANRERLGRI